MKKIKLSVPAMQSAHCQNRVKKSIEALREINISALQPGLLEIETPDDYFLKNLYTAIQSAGYEIMGVETEVFPKEKENILNFKSNINCMGCVEAVAPVLNGHDAIEGWKVDLTHKDRILTIESAGISEAEVIGLVFSKGFKAERI